MKEEGGSGGDREEVMDAVLEGAGARRVEGNGWENRVYEDDDHVYSLMYSCRKSSRYVFQGSRRRVCSVPRKCKISSTSKRVKQTSMSSLQLASQFTRATRSIQMF